MNNKKGFTLIEVLAVIVLLGILVSVATVGVSKYRKDVDEKEVYSIKQTIKAAFTNYRILEEVNAKEWLNKDNKNIIQQLRFDGGNTLKYSGETCNIDNSSKVLYLVNGDYLKNSDADESFNIAFKTCEFFVEDGSDDVKCLKESGAFVPSKMETICIKLSCDEGNTFIIDDFSDDNSLCSKVIFE